MSKETEKLLWVFESPEVFGRKFRIARDSMNFIIQHRRKRKNIYEWEGKYFYGNLNGALRKMADLIHKDRNANTRTLTIEQYLKEYNSIAIELSNTIESINKNALSEDV